MVSFATLFCYGDTGKLMSNSFFSKEGQFMVKVILEIISSETFNLNLNLCMDHSIKLGKNIIEFIFELQ